MTDIRCPVNEAATISQNEAAIIGKHGILPYIELEQCVRATAELLLRKGVKPETRVVLSVATEWQFPVLLMALLRVGVVACPVEGRMSTKKILSVVDELGASHVVTSAKKAQTLSASGCNAIPVGELVGFIGKFDAHDHVRFDMDKIATLVPVKESPKDKRWVAHSFENHYYSAKGSNVNIRLHKDCRWMLTVPMDSAEGIGILFRCMLSGTGFVMPDPRKTLVEAAKEYEATHLSLDPQQFEALLDEVDSAKALPSLQAVVLLVEESQALLVRRAQEKGFRVFSSFGLPEMASSVTASAVESNPDQRCTAGKPLRHREIMIADDGELLVRGHTLFKGYLVEGDLQLPIDSEGWFCSGKYGTIADDGYLHLRSHS